MSVILVAVAVLLGAGLAALLLHHRRIDRLATFAFPDRIVRKVQMTYPHLRPEECEQVMRGLRQFFAVAIAARGRQVAMPSQAVDTALWICSRRDHSGGYQSAPELVDSETPAGALLVRRARSAMGRKRTLAAPVDQP